MFINKNIDADRLKKETNNKPNKKIPVSGIFRVKTKNTSFDMLVVNSDDTSISDRFWNENYFCFLAHKLLVDMREVLNLD